MQVRCDFEHVYGSFDAPLRRLVRSRIRDAAAAEDVLQEVYLKVHSRLHTLRDCARLPAWLHRIARNAIVDHYRSRRPLEPLSEELPDRADPCADDLICELAAGLAPMIATLPAKYRQALRLTLDEGLTREEVAGRLGLSVSGAKSRVQRARDLLGERLLDCCHFELDRFGHPIDYRERCPCCSGGRRGAAGRGERAHPGPPG
jgi:RNA polymerase sigma-70 factor (ECF subfamily)